MHYTVEYLLNQIRKTSREAFKAYSNQEHTWLYAQSLEKRIEYLEGILLENGIDFNKSKTNLDQLELDCE